MDFISKNPANLSEIVAKTSGSTSAQIISALERAKNAQRKWAAIPAPARGRVIANVGRLVEKNKENLSKLVTKEMGKVFKEALGEVQEVIPFFL